MSDFKKELNSFVIERCEDAYQELMKAKPEFVELREKIIAQKEKLMKNLSEEQMKRFFRLEEYDVAETIFGTTLSICRVYVTAFLF